MEHLEQGWQPDPFGRHGERWMSGGTATDLVRDGAREGRDAPAASPPPEPPARPHWIDVDRLPRTDGRSPLPWPLNRLRPTYPEPEPAPARWRVAVTVALTCASAFVTLAFLFGHPVTPAPPLPPDEVIGQVAYATPQSYVVYYSLPNDPDFLGVADGSSPDAAAGQEVVVRYDPSKPLNATVVSWTPPHSRRNGVFGIVVVTTLWAVTLGSSALTLQRRWRRRQEREQNTDYRRDQWAGSSASR